MTVLVSLVVAWWNRVQAKRAARTQARQHLAIVAQAIWTGSTEAYTLTRVDREPDSTRIQW